MSRVEKAMPAIRVKRTVRHSAEQMLELVADVERYPEFVPLCARHRIVSRAKEGPKEILIADMTIAFGPLRETIRVRDTIDRENGRIRLDGLAGPLRYLQGAWTFTPNESGGCDVGLQLSYELANPLLAAVLGRVLDVALSGFLAAFVKRADLIHLRPPRSTCRQTLGRLGKSAKELRRKAPRRRAV
jgi:coenzyme Q-binding protein COQ10